MGAFSIRRDVVALTRWGAIGGALLVLAALSLAGGGRRAEVQPAMRVELDVFSGRPNPAWELAPEEVAELAQRLTGLPRTDQPPGEGGLGYRGFTISNPSRSAGLPAEIRVFSGVLALPENGAMVYHRDEHDVERWLLAQAARHGYGDLVR